MNIFIKVNGPYLAFFYHFKKILQSIKLQLWLAELTVRFVKKKINISKFVIFQGILSKKYNCKISLVAISTIQLNFVIEFHKKTWTNIWLYLYIFINISKKSAFYKCLYIHVKIWYCSFCPAHAQALQRQGTLG